eukprot:2599230-Amphidinium_carterae.2
MPNSSPRRLCGALALVSLLLRASGAGQSRQALRRGHVPGMRSFEDCRNNAFCSAGGFHQAFCYVVSLPQRSGIKVVRLQ